MYDVVNLKGTYLLPNGSPAKGTVEIIPSEKVIVDDGGDVLLSGRVKVELDETGSFSVNLPATDDPRLNPTGFGYTVAARLNHHHPPAVSFPLPAAVPVVDITDVTTVDPSTFAPGVNYVTPAELDAAVTGVTVDTSGLEAEIATKADAGATTTALAAKVDKTGADALVATLVDDPASATKARLSATYARITRPYTIALLGDSITNQNSTADSATIFYYSATGYFTWANILDGQRWTIVTPDGSNIGEFGASGKRTDQLISEGHSAAAAASSAGYVMVHGGTNDLASRTAAQIAADLLTIWRHQTAAGKRVIATTILPRNGTGDTAATRDKIRDANRLIRANAATELGVTLCDWYAALVDPTTGTVASGFMEAADGVHPISTGAARMGKVLAAVLAGLGPHDWNSRLPWDAADVKSLMPNPFQVGATAGVSTSANVYTLGAGVYTSSKVARTDGIAGEWQQVAVTSAPAPNADGAQYQQQNTAVGVDWNVGDTVYGVCEFETDAAAWAMRHLNFEIALYNGIGSAGGLRLSTAARTALTAPLPLLPRGILRTPNFVIPSGVTRLQANVHIYGVGTVRIGRFDVIKA